jgi:D-serine deaminase-like pyridoxal phosphate-dependent protein
MVQSRPEPTLAILTMGKRDVSYDVDLPIPLSYHRPGPGAPHPLPAGCSISSSTTSTPTCACPKAIRCARSWAWATWSAAAFPTPARPSTNGRCS